MQEAPTYREQSRNFVVKARRELDEDLPQASEKGWGAAAEIVKAIAEERGWTHRGHRELQTAVNRLRNETGDRDLQRLFAIASDLHRNFYENWYDQPAVESGIQDVERFVAKVESLLSANR